MMAQRVVMTVTLGPDAGAVSYHTSMKSKKSHNRQARMDPSGIPPGVQRGSSSVACFIYRDAKNIPKRAQESRADSVDV
jgi:hypothetical protein